MVRIVPSDIPRVPDPKVGITKKVNPTPAEQADGDALEKNPTMASRLAEVIHMFTKKKRDLTREQRYRNKLVGRYLESQDQFDVGEARGFKIDRKV